MFVYVVAWYQGGVRQLALLDGDTYMHVAAGQWVLAHWQVPHADPFSHTVAGAPWTAHEWLAEVVLALCWKLAGWNGLVALTALCFALAIAILARFLMPVLAPSRVVLLAMLGALLTHSHLLARPHMLALPLLVLWTAQLSRSSEEGRPPPWWLCCIMLAWANLHGGFTLGLAIAGGFALEAVWSAWSHGQGLIVAKRWGLFLAAATASALLTPHGIHGILFTWQMIVQQDYMRSRVGEWASPNFHQFQPLMLWLLLGMATVLYQGLRLPPMRILMLLALIYLALKHIRNIELLGLLGPVLVARSFGAQWRSRQGNSIPADRFARSLAGMAEPASSAAVLAVVASFGITTALFMQTSPATPPAEVAPIQAIDAARAAGASGPVLNGYRWGGWLIQQGVPVFIDGRADMYGDAFLKQYSEAIELRHPGDLERLLARYDIQWTLLAPGTPANVALAKLPNWRLAHSDADAVVYVRTDAKDEGGR